MMIRYKVMLNGEWLHDNVGTSTTAKPSEMTKEEVCDLITMTKFNQGSVLNIFAIETKGGDE